MSRPYPRKEAAATKRRIFALIFCCLALFALAPSAGAAPGGAMKITVSVPFKVTLDIGEHGSVTVGGKTYKRGDTIYAEPGAELVFTFAPESGYEIEKAFYGSEDITEAAKSGIYRAAAADGDITLTVSFKKKSVPSGGGSAKTVDGANYPLFAVLTVISGAALTAMTIKERRRKA